MVSVKSIHDGTQDSFDEKLKEHLEWLLKHGYLRENIKVEKVSFIQNGYYTLIIAYKDDEN